MRRYEFKRKKGAISPGEKIMSKRKKEKEVKRKEEEGKKGWSKVDRKKRGKV